MIVLVTGGRDYSGDVSCLDMIKIDILIHGGAKGADQRAALYCQSKGIHCAQVNALWNVYDRGAGFRRNSAMLMLKPDYCVAFPGGNGTKMMKELCENHGIPVWEPYV